MGKKPTQEGGVGPLEGLRTALEAALSLARDLSDDQLLARIIAVFRAMPMQDRPVIVSVLEREVTGRLLSRATEKPVGQSTHPNPNARLYVRAHGSSFDRRAFERDEMMIADVRALRIAPLIRNVPELYATWKDALREAVTHVDEATRAVAEDLLRDGLAAIAEARAAEVSAASETPPTSDTPPDEPDESKRTRRS